MNKTKIIVKGELFKPGYSPEETNVDFRFYYENGDKIIGKDGAGEEDE